MHFVYYPAAMSRFVFVLCLLVSSLGGCLPDTSGQAPPYDKFIYPVGLAMTSGDRYLLVVSSNFDLKYNSGTVVALDTAGLASASGEVSEDGEYLFVDETQLILEDQTIRLGAFASDLALTPAGDRAMIPVRGDRGIVLIDIDEAGGGDLLSCGEGDDRRCAQSHIVGSNDNHTLPIEPYEVAALDYQEPNGGTTTLGFATHLAGGEVSMFVLQDGASGSTAAAELIGVVRGVVPGASGIAVNHVTHDIYVSGRHDPDPHVAVMRVLTDGDNGYYSNNPYFNQVDHIDLAAEMYSGTDARGMAVTSDGERAFLVTRSPEALLSLDVSGYAMLDMTTVGTDPSSVALFEDDLGTVDPADDRVYAFVLCFATDQVFIIDPDLMKVLTVRSTGAGPQAIAFDRTAKIAYVANFHESTLTVIQAAPPFDHLRDADGRVIKIGRPRLPESHD